MAIVFIIWIGLAFVAANVARSKGRSGFGYFVLSCLLSFLVAIIVLAIVPSRNSNFDPLPRTACPYCREQIIAAAVVCKHCGRDVEPDLELIAKTYATQSTKSKPLSAYGKWGVALILLGSLSILSWVSGMKTWSTAEEANVPLWGRILTLVVEVAILVWGIVLYSTAIKKANENLFK
jgi:hypothetical protein